ncbi:transporter [Algoriphagus lacus]|uniref:Transporter n=1 Tax=Algoriphagus lacus TaxID=2056311 RepID=A0A418PV75_9BACT|nr:transporter [Algoriphagus lacus]RIW17460.1 transporter [Algoriphagus lacus]
MSQILTLKASCWGHIDGRYTHQFNPVQKSSLNFPIKPVTTHSFRILSWFFKSGTYPIIKKAFLLTLLILFSEKLFSQELIQTDRPDQTEGVFVVDKKTLQIETGFFVGKNRDQTYNYIIPTTLLKYGITKNLELQSIIDVINIQGKYGVAPVALGFKANFVKEKGIRPEIALIGRAQVKNLGGQEYKINKTLTMFRVAFQNTLSDLVVLGYNFGMQWNEFEKPSYILSVTSNFNLSRQLTVYTELFNFTSEQSFLNPIVDFGGMYSFKNRFIVDAAIGKHLNPSNQQNFFFTLGFTTRFSFLKKGESNQN